MVVQLTDVGRAPRSAAHRQPEVHQGRGAEAARLGRAGSGAPQAARRARRARALPKFELAERQNDRRCRAVRRRQVRLPGRHRSRAGAQRASAALRQRSSLHRRDSRRALSSATRRIAAARGPESRRPAKRCGPGSTASATRSPSEAAVWRRGRGRRREAGVRRRSASALGMPMLSADGQHRASRSVRAADNTERWLVPIDPATGKTRRARSRSTTTRGSARRAGRSVSGGGCRTTSALVPRRARRLDASLHASTRRRRRRQKQLTTGQVRDRLGRAVAATAGRSTSQSTEAHPGERHLYAMSVDGGARTQAHVA